MICKYVRRVEKRRWKRCGRGNRRSRPQGIFLLSQGHAQEQRPASTPELELTLALRGVLLFVPLPFFVRCRWCPHVVWPRETIRFGRGQRREVGWASSGCNTLRCMSAAHLPTGLDMPWPSVRQAASWHPSLVSQRLGGRGARRCLRMLDRFCVL